ncbi:MAG: sulfite exporter TauE/SafE family protein [Armatimonadetes bacterium]|nr:sulfite exporter TauE/SafE family protein [Armatimonadota bacterium]MBX3108217.1 sulfite exporter TauE/SafE family protein [Fimbriimonadaceae bacterium]
MGNLLPYVLAALAGFAASAVNAVAGGGTLISFPTLMALGLPTKTANATNAVALWPGSASGALGFHKYFDETKSQLKTLLPPTIAGALLGSALLVATNEKTFKVVVPFLILAATLLLAFQGRNKWAADQSGFKLKAWQVAGLQFLVSLYGGYFGAGMGIMMLAVMSLYEGLDLHRLNVLKNWLAVVINFGASIILLSQKLVDLPFAAAMMVGALFGGYASAFFAQKIAADKLRFAVVLYGFVMVAYLFWGLFRGA